MILSDQAVGALMLALQNSLASQTDIVPVIKGFEFFLKDGELFVENPPHIKMSDYDEEVEHYEDEVE